MAECSHLNDRPGEETAQAMTTYSFDYFEHEADIGVIGYKLYRDGAYLESAGVASTTSIADAGAIARTTYTYAVSALDAAGRGLKLFEPTTRLGLWTFAERLDGDASDGGQRLEQEPASRRRHLCVRRP